MKVKHLFPTFICCSIFLLTSGCGSKKKDLNKYLVDASEFHVEQDKLHSGDSLEILGASGTITNEDKIDAYILYVVRSLRTGETLNILSTDYIMIRDQSEIIRFISDTDDAGKIAAYATHGKELPEGKIDEIEPLRFDKVFYDTDWIHENVRKYPAVIGQLAQYYSQSSSMKTPEENRSGPDSTDKAAQTSASSDS